MGVLGFIRRRVDHGIDGIDEEELQTDVEQVEEKPTAHLPHEPL